jgi:hypothetical protein
MKVPFFFPIISIFFFSVFSCKSSKEHPYIANSLREDVDLFLIPEKFNILESDWVETSATAHYSKEDLIRHLKSYGRTLNDLKKDPSLQYTENDDVISLHVKKTSHSTDYNYDKKIPIIFYGPRWFIPGEYSQVIHQQHIVPTLAKILGIRNPNGVETHPILSILANHNVASKPEIIVTIVIDQGGQQLYKSHPDVPVMINSIKKQAAYFPNAEVGHLDAHTAVGHAAIGTGAYPSKNNVIGNTFYNYIDGKVHGSEIYAKEDESKVDPSELTSESLSDVLDIENGDKSEVISQCYALRASIGMAGHGAYKQKNVSYIGDKDLVYWIDRKTKKWTTDDRYYTIPSFLTEYDPINNFLKEYPHGWNGHIFKDREDAIQNWAIVLGSPAEVKSEVQIFIRTIEEYIIKKNKHNDGLTDLAYLTLKATDSTGHTFGWESLESREVFGETDKQIGLIFEMLQKHYGDKFILVITADHGCAPMPEISGGKRLSFNLFFKELQSLLPSTETESLAKFATVGQVALNRDLMKKYNITEQQVQQKILSIQVDGKNFFKEVILKSEYQSK